MSANELTARLLLVLPELFPSWFWRNNRLKAPMVGRGGKTRFVNAGIDGQGDITGILTVHHAGCRFGVRAEIEVKVGRDRQSPVQKSFENKVRKMGGVYIIARSVEECVAELEEQLANVEESFCES